MYSANLSWTVMREKIDKLEQLGFDDRGWQLRYRGYTISGQEPDALAIIVEALRSREKKDQEILVRSQRAKQGVIERSAKGENSSGTFALGGSKLCQFFFTAKVISILYFYSKTTIR
jgi:hypothetical protein